MGTVHADVDLSNVLSWERHMTKPLFLCYFERSGDEWEGISVDYDIAVCGRSADEVKTLLKSAILSYIEDAK